MSQVTNFYPIVNVFNAMTAFSRLIDLGAAVNGKALPDMSFQTGLASYDLYVDKVDGVQGYRVKVNDVPLEQGRLGLHTAEEIMKFMIEQYENNHKGKLPFVVMVKDGDDEVKLFLDGSILIKSERGVQLAEMSERHPGMVTQALENILTATV